MILTIPHLVRAARLKKGQESDINQARVLYQEYKKRKKKAREVATQSDIDLEDYH